MISMRALECLVTIIEPGSLTQAAAQGRTQLQGPDARAISQLWALGICNRIYEFFEALASCRRPRHHDLSQHAK
jgi:hypothetical protein